METVTAATEEGQQVFLTPDQGEVFLEAARAARQRRYEATVAGKEEENKPASMNDKWAVGAFKPKAVDRRSPEEISQLARDIATNKVFTSHQIREFDTHLIGSIFMPVAFGCFSDTTEEYRKDIGFLYEYYDKAGPRAINGYPMFFSVAYVGKADAILIGEKVDKLLKVMEEI